jgi:streptogramin lyase
MLAVIFGGCTAAPKMTGSGEYVFWPAAPDAPRLQYLTSINDSRDVQPPRTAMDELIYGREVQEVMPVNKPYGLKMHNGSVYVCDQRNHCVTVLDLRKQQMRLMGTTGTDALRRPTDIAIAEDGTIYVADLGRGSIAVFDAQERRVTSIAPPELRPVGLAVRANELYVCDSGKQQVLVLDRHSGQVLRTIGEPGVKDGQFYIPLGIDVDASGNVYVSDVMTCRVQKFDREGKLVKAFGRMTPRMGGFVRPKQLTVDSDGNVYVVDAAFSNVQVFDPDGKLLTYFGSAGKHPGAMELPVGVCVSDTGLDLFSRFIHPAFEARRLVLVSNQVGSNKIAVYALGQLKKGKTLADVSRNRLDPASGLADPRTVARAAPTALSRENSASDQPAAAAPSAASPPPGGPAGEGAAPDVPATAMPDVPAAAAPDVPAAAAPPAPPQKRPAAAAAMTDVARGGQ